MVLSCGQMPPTVTSLKVIVGVASQSVAVADPVLAGNVLAVHCIVTLIGQVITGGVLSSTTIVCIQLLEFPQSSVATQVREMVLSCGHAPPEVTSLKVTVGVPSQLSVAVGTSACAAASPAASLQFTVRFSEAGAVVHVGACVSAPV